jgi:hypothetical protein
MIKNVAGKRRKNTTTRNDHLDMRYINGFLLASGPSGLTTEAGRDAHPAGASDFRGRFLPTIATHGDGDCFLLDLPVYHTMNIYNQEFDQVNC